MFFYLLGFVITFTTIFGIVHSQTAREKLHLQDFYTWSSSTIQQQLQQYNLYGIRNNSDVDEIIEILEITVDQLEIPESHRTRVSERIAHANNTNVQTISSEVSSSNEVQSNQNSENNDNVLAAISASLQRLSSAANSGRINGAQLYQILLQETLKHENAARLNNDEIQINKPNSSVVIQEIKEDKSKIVEEPEKQKMYFGEKPLEYVPHQK